MNAPLPDTGLIVYEAAGVVDADRTLMVGEASGGVAILVEHAPNASRPMGARVLAAGARCEVAAHPSASTARRVHLGSAVVLPGLVNAHTHLDLTHLGPVAHPAPSPPGRGFTDWAGVVMQGRRLTPEGVQESVRLGVERCLAGGVVAVGDIAGVGSLDAYMALGESPLAGVSFVEFFGMGRRQAPAADVMRQLFASAPKARGAVRVGLSPHATYSAGPGLYAAATGSGAAICTHAAETIDEREFIESGSGSVRELLARLGVWDDSILGDIGRGKRPLEHLRAVLERGPMLLAHVNDATDEEIDLLARTGALVAYCPRAHAYFGNAAALGPHRYRDMLSAGVTVALGTDSILNLPPDPRDERGWPTLSTLDEARLLVRRDGLDARTAIALCTTLGARALGLDPRGFTLSPGPVHGLCAVGVTPTAPGGPADWVMRSAEPARLLTPQDATGACRESGGPIA